MILYVMRRVPPSWGLKFIVQSLRMEEVLGGLGFGV